MILDTKWLWVLLICASVSAFALAPPAVTAQTPFRDCAAQTGSNASLVLPSTLEITIDGVKKKPPLFLAIFTPDGHCAGRAHWSGSATTLTAWGTANRHHAYTDSTALAPGDTLQIHLYDPATSTAYTPSNSQIGVTLRSDEPHLSEDFRYVPNGIYLLDQIRVVKSALITRQER